MSDDFNDEPESKRSKKSWGESSYCRKKSPTITDLPPEILIQIFKYLDFKSLSHCALLCKQFYDVSNNRELYKIVHLKYNMDTSMMTSYINKISYPTKISIEYNVLRSTDSPANYSEFDEYVTWLIRKTSEHVTSVVLESCHNESVLVLLCECQKLLDIKCMRCVGTFDALPTLKNLVNIFFCNTNIPNKILIETLQNNPNLKKLYLASNEKVNIVEVCQTLAKYNKLIEELEICESKKAKAKGLRALAQCSNLKILELTNGPFHCDPEDSLEQLAAGCPLLEKLAIYGWKEVNDQTLLPILRYCIRLKFLELRGTNVTIRSCREAALSLPFLKSIDIFRCWRIKKEHIANFQRGFKKIKLFT